MVKNIVIWNATYFFPQPRISLRSKNHNNGLNLEIKKRPRHHKPKLQNNYQ